MFSAYSSSCQSAAHEMPAMQIRLRLREEIKDGSYYEAQQTYKATYYRYVGKGAHEDAYALLRV